MDIKPCPTRNLDGRTYLCHFELTLQVMGGKWKPIILYHLSRLDVMRFSDLRRSVTGVTERMLARQLRELEADGLVHREVFKVVPPRVEYRLTGPGRDLIPILDALKDWGRDYEARRLDLQAGARPAARACPAQAGREAGVPPA